jgi:hypothetical protein
MMLLVATAEFTGSDDTASTPCALPLNPGFPVPAALYVHVKLAEAPPVIPTLAGAGPLISINPPVPTAASEVGAVALAITSPLLLTVITTCAHCPMFITAGLMLKLLVNDAGFDTLTKLDETAAENIDAPVLASFPLANTLYASVHGLAPAPPSVLMPVYVKLTLAAAVSTAAVGVGPCNASGLAVPSFPGFEGTTLMAVASPLLLTVTTNLYACPSTRPAGNNATETTFNCGPF